MTDYEEHPVFTEKSKIVLSLTEPTEADGLTTSIDEDIYFTFYDVADDVKTIEYDYVAERSITFDVETQDGERRVFTLYAYDWSDAIYCLTYDFCFQAE